MHNAAVDWILSQLGKALTDPLLFFLMVIVIFLGVVYRRSRDDRSLRRFVFLMLLLTLAFGFLSTGFGAMIMRDFLLIEASPAMRPDVIVVASGGHLPGDSRVEDVLTHSSHIRIVKGATWWLQNRHAQLVITGRDTYRRNPSRSIDLMREEAIEQGVPADRIILEPQSRNTREHPRNVLRLPGIKRQTRIGLVTSDWHMRRTKREFERHFTVVIPFPSIDGDDDPSYSLSNFLPNSYALQISKIMLQEWIGLAWYALTE